jgi:Fe-S-cluster containining protein
LVVGVLVRVERGIVVPRARYYKRPQAQDEGHHGKKNDFGSKFRHGKTPTMIPSEVQAKPESRCTGHCCRMFFLPYSPDQLREEYQRWLRTDGDAVIHKGHIGYGQAKPLLAEIHLIYPMVIHLSESYPDGYAMVNPRDVDPEEVSAGHFYTCKHLDRTTDNCTIYEDRPGMCRDYPYRGSCNYAECTWTERKALPVIQEPAHNQPTKYSQDATDEPVQTPAEFYGAVFDKHKSKKKKKKHRA